jgi:hypothetical protein|tara:strand:+ start:934 stop:1059 length:126 start_codon:yes stop_codon:yes gene_type:complete
MNKKTVLVYKAKLVWLFIAGWICGTILGTAIVKIWGKWTDW